MADVTKNHEALLVLASFAAQGYIVVAPNYLGYSGSALNYHPYMNAAASSTDMVDGLRAGLTQANATGGTGGTTPSKQLFVSGYSEGGYVAMATARALQTNYSNEFSVTAAVTMSGPYDLAAFGDAIVSGEVNVGATLFMPLLLTSYQNVYGNVYREPSDAYQAPFDKTAPTLFPTDVSINDLVADGELPANDPTFSNLWDDGGLLLPAFRASYPNSALRSDMQANTLLGWTPKAPLAMCGGADDPTVFFLNSQNAQKDFASRGTQVPLWNLEDRASLPAGVSDDEVFGLFQASKLASGSNVDKEYHALLVPPACFALARGFFANYTTSDINQSQVAHGLSNG
jgi:pimeloyl-ACP methyl ester carboxylesterase